MDCVTNVLPRTSRLTSNVCACSSFLGMPASVSLSSPDSCLGYCVVLKLAVDLQHSSTEDTGSLEPKRIIVNVKNGNKCHPLINDLPLSTGTRMYKILQVQQKVSANLNTILPTKGKTFKLGTISKARSSYLTVLSFKTLMNSGKALGPRFSNK
ncbi:hypothetical protein P5673_014952 [Acropora cervicornis]|uniref:Uncharacterized protein n=1 Tax=Acropora cervicornis TaxID=6130 RepID=A0AAD9QJ19_ACRCE|nr:hypothetical protein P5673_014952 [Acropora cervicornis]